MKNLEILVATMKQKDMSLVEKMNLRCDAVIANQADEYGYQSVTTEYGTVKMISTDTIGVGRNRNMALALADSEIVLFADDDITYYDDGAEGVIRAFDELKDADVIAFSLDISKNGNIVQKRRWKIQKRHLWNVFKYGTCVLAARRSSLAKNGIAFNTVFGGGCVYGSGEDSTFLRECLRKGLKIYSHSHVLGVSSKDGSSWFQGFNEKYFHDKGAWIACAFPCMKHLIKWYYVWRLRKKTELKVREIVKQLNHGIRNYKTLTPYQEGK